MVLLSPPLAAVCLLGKKHVSIPLEQLLRDSTDSLRQRAGSGGAGSSLLLRKQLQIHCPGVFSPVPCGCTRAPGPSGRHPWVPRAQHFVALPTPQMTTCFLISKPWSGQGPENKLTPSPPAQSPTKSDGSHAESCFLMPMVGADSLGW